NPATPCVGNVRQPTSEDDAMRWFHHNDKSGRPRKTTKRRQTRARAMVLEALEGRQLLATINWTNRGGPNNDSDGFQNVFGAQRAAIARNDVAAAIIAWENIITSFNYSSGPDTFDLSVSMSSKKALGGNGDGGSY